MQAVRDSVASLPAGQTWNKREKNIAALLEPYLSKDSAKQRATLLLRTHAFQAFATSNWRSLQADDDTTYLQYLATEDNEVRPIHRALNGIVLPKQDPFWDEHYPPWEENCRCRIRGMNPDFWFLAVFSGIIMVLLQLARAAWSSIPKGLRRPMNPSSIASGIPPKTARNQVVPRNPLIIKKNLN
jgi:SPP1 gp7 family putative phage head morphogenesis protein